MHFMNFQFELHPDQEFVGMAERIRKKLEKYWLEAEELNPSMNNILYVAALLDPRQKLQHVEKCLIIVYGETWGAELVRVVKDYLEEFFAFYKAHHANLTQPSLKKPTFSTPPVEMRQHSQARFRARKRGSCSLLRQVEPNAIAISEIAVYLIEDQLNLNEGALHDDESELESFDILKWWMMRNPRFPFMVEMAKDILAIPISIVASECAFSSGGRVFSPFRRSLAPVMVEALICAEDWLRSISTSTIFLSDKEEDIEGDQEKAFDRTAQARLGLGGGSMSIARTSESAQTRQSDI